MSKVKPGVKIMLDRERNMVFDMNAMSSYEKSTGKNLLNMSVEKATVADLRALLWACLLTDDPGLNIEDVGRMVTLRNMAEVAGKIAQVYQESMPEGEEASEDDAPLAVNSPATPA